MEHLEMIISYEDLEKNRKKHLLADKRRIKQRKKERTLNVIGIAFFYIVIVLGVIGLNARFEQINEQTKSTNEPTSRIVQNYNR